MQNLNSDPITPVPEAPENNDQMWAFKLIKNTNNHMDGSPSKCLNFTCFH